ncbi:MAG: sulfite exporter TauE/SafE family protein [Betaproteobacteria bacterium]|nr:sulfite exporter TauE/SafE family protein [Betaproteobacteria bacterium]
MESLGTLELIFAALVVVAAYAVRGTAGFGGQAVAVPLLALILPLTVVIAAVAMLTALASLGQVRRDWRRIEWREIARLVPYTVLGVLAGLFLLQQLDVRTLVKAFGVFVILYACFALASASRPLAVSARFRYPLAALLGTSAAVAGTVFGAAGGPLYVIYLGTAGLEKNAFRATITTILGVLALLRIAGYAQLELYDLGVLTLVAAGLPLMFLGSRIGNWLAGRLEQKVFNRGVAVMLLASGTALLFK